MADFLKIQYFGCCASFKKLAVPLQAEFFEQDA